MNWKLIAIRIVVNGIAIAITAFLLPGIQVADSQLTTYLILAATFGLLNTFVKPIVQFLTLSFLFVTYGSVIVIINTIMLLLLEFLLPELLSVQSWLWALAGGLLMGFLGLILENLLGVTPPIVDPIDMSRSEG